MNQIIKTYLDNKLCKTKEDYYSALREVLQNIILIGLKNGGFFNKASFYGGTALRIFYGIDRFSEDLDFTLLENDDNFSFSPFFPYIKDIAESYGFAVELSNVDKTKQTNIISAFLKADTSLTMINFTIPEDIIRLLPSQNKIKIKFEVDIHPPLGFVCESKTLYFPEPTSISTLNLDSLFAGKIAAILCRGRKFNIKGRDYYDYLFFIGLNAKINLTYLKSKLNDNNYDLLGKELDIDLLRTMLKEKFETVDIEKIKQDVMPFVSDKNKLNSIDKSILIDSLKYLH